MRAAPVAVATAVAVVAAVGVGVAVASSGDDARPVDAVGVGAVTVDDGSAGTTSSPTGTASASPTSSATPQQVDGLEQLQGVLTRDPDDSDDDGSDDDSSDDDSADFEVAGVDLDLGPDGWLVSGGAVADFDGDGTVRPVVEELQALVGQEVTVAGRFETDDRDDSDDDGSDDSGRDGSDGRDDDLDVYEIQGVAYRDTTGGPAPWATAGATGTATTDDSDDRGDDDSDDRGDDNSDDGVDDGSAAPAGGPSRTELEEIATDAVGADSRVTSVDREDDDGAAWEIEVLDAQGVEQRVLLDAAGTVVDIRPED